MPPSPNLQPNGKPLVPRRQKSVGATASPPPGEEKISFRLSPPFKPHLHFASPRSLEGRFARRGGTRCGACGKRARCRKDVRDWRAERRPPCLATRNHKFALF